MASGHCCIIVRMFSSISPEDFVMCSSLRLMLNEFYHILVPRSSHFRKLDVDHLYMSYADIMAKVSVLNGYWNSYCVYSFSVQSSPLTLCMYCVVSLQSCHIGEEDEGGEEEGEEPAFEVRQTEMVWGDQGKGTRGVSGAGTPQSLSDHTKPPHPAHSPPLPHAPSLPVSFSPSLTPLVSFPAMVDWLVHSFCWTLPCSLINVAVLICVSPRNCMTLSAERWCD